MKEYNRLTTKGSNYYDDIKVTCAEEIYEQLKDLEDKIERGELIENKVVTYINMARSGNKTLIDKALKYDELKAKIENGTLIELPCKVGDKVYRICGTPKRKFIKEKICWGICFNNFGVEIHTDGAVDIISDDIFLTKAEAEAKLKELQNER